MNEGNVAQGEELKKFDIFSVPVENYDALVSLDKYELQAGHLLLEIKKRPTITKAGILIPENTKDGRADLFPVIKTAEDCSQFEGKIALSMNIRGLRDMFTIRGRRFGIIHNTGIYSWTDKDNFSDEL